MTQDIVILYIDDEPINILLFELNFKRKFNVLTATSGSGGLEKMASNPEIKVVISDMKMPEMNGIEFIKLAKQQYPLVAYYILTGFDMTEEIESALKSQLIKRYFNKPFNMTEICNAIESIV